jgi:hypothetical protein
MYHLHGLTISNQISNARENSRPKMVCLCSIQKGDFQKKRIVPNIR